MSVRDGKGRSFPRGCTWRGKIRQVIHLFCFGARNSTLTGIFIYVVMDFSFELAESQAETGYGM